MFNRVLNDLKDCERDLQMIAGDAAVDEWVANKLRRIIYTIEDAQKNLWSIADSYKVVPNVTNNRQSSAKFKTAGELLDFLLGLRDRDLNKRVVIGKNVWDERMFMKWCSVQYKAEWIRNDDEDIMIFCK